MQLLNLLCPALLALLFAPSPALSKPPKNAILLSNVKTLTLRENAKTTHRRVSAIPQLTCKGPGCKHYKVDIMRCKNEGSDYLEEDIQWSCIASIPEEFKLGSTDVICEGYSSSDDDYVLKGSCGVEYRLLLTSKGEEKYGSGGFWGSKPKKATSGGGNEGWNFGSVLFVIIFIGIAGWILYSIFTGITQGGATPRLPRRPGGFGGGGWGGGGGDPPPPYPGYKPTSTEGWQPGFWSGALGGAAAGYMAGNRGQRQREQARGSSWFGGGNSGSSFGNSSRNSGSGSSSSSSSSSSSARRENTGFGSTSRR